MSDQARAGEPEERSDAARVLRQAADERTLHEALGLVSALEHTTAARASASLRAVGLSTGHTPLCVARELLHLVFPASHPLLPAAHATGSATLTEAVQRRWRWPLHQLRCPDPTAGPRVWDRVRTPGAVVASPHPRLN
jgi:hypothetical protein